MQFTNKTSDALRTRWGLIEPDAPVVVTVDEAAGLVLQCGADGNWAPADDDAKAAVAEALAAPMPAPTPLPEPPAVKPDPKPAPTPDAAPTPAEAVPAEEK